MAATQTEATYVVAIFHNVRTGRHTYRSEALTAQAAATEAARWAVWPNVKSVYITEGSPYFQGENYRQVK